jgi:SAM-dependent methyltransferase
VKKGMRSLLLWYVGWITHQVSQFASAVSRTLHIVDGRLKEVERQVEVQRVPSAGVVEFPELNNAGAWWVTHAVDAVAKVPGRTLHSACGDGWLVRAIGKAGGDAYGVDPRVTQVEQGLLLGSDLREEALADHLGAVARAGLAAVVLSATVEGLAGGERDHLMNLIATRLAPGGVLVIHSLTRDAWEAPDAPIAADLAPGRPLRPDTWCHVLEQRGYQVSTQDGPDGADFMVTAVRAHVTPLASNPDE